MPVDTMHANASLALAGIMSYYIALQQSASNDGIV